MGYDDQGQQGYPPQGYPPQGYPPQGYPAQQPAYAPQQGYDQQQGYAPQGQPAYAPQQGYPAPQQGYPAPQQGYPAPQAQPDYAQQQQYNPGVVQGLPVTAPPAAPSVIIQHSVRGQDWSHGICDCGDNCGLCCLAFFCPCIMEGKLYEATGQSFCLGCFFWFCLQAIGAEMGGCGWCVGCHMRGQIRSRYGIEGNMLMDVCCHLFCWPCAMTQEWNHIEKHGGGAAGTTVIVQGAPATHNTF